MADAVKKSLLCTYIAVTCPKTKTTLATDNACKTCDQCGTTELTSDKHVVIGVYCKFRRMRSEPEVKPAEEKS